MTVFPMRTKYVIMFAAVATLIGAIVSMATSGIFVSAQSNSNTSTSTTDSDFVKEGLIDADERGTGERTDADDTEEQEDAEDCVENDKLEAAASEGEEDSDEPGDEDVNDEEDEGVGNEDQGELDDEEQQSAPGTNSTSVETEEEDEKNVPFEPCNFSNEIDNPYMPLSKYVGKTLTFEGTSTEDGTSVKTRELWNVRSKTVDIADVETLVVVVQEFEDEKLVREALQYYAQGKDGVVYNFGEDMADYENGQAVENDEESWTVGDHTATPGIAMPASPAAGMGFAFQFVNVPGIAHELHEVKSLTNSISVGLGSFTNVLAVNDYDFNTGKTSEEFYALGVGLIKEVDDDEELELSSIS